MKAARSAGGFATARKHRGKGLDTATLPPLDSHQAAKEWLEAIGRGVLGRNVTHQEAQAAIRAVDSWLRAEGERVTMHVVDELKAEVQRLKGELSRRPQMQRAG